MANFGANESKFNKPYLGMLASDIQSGKEIKFAKGKGVIDPNNSVVKAFVKAVESNNQTNVNKVLKNGNQYAPVFALKNGNVYKWSEIDKSQYSGVAKKSDAKTTAMQERASMYAIEKGLNKNGYKYKKQFLKDCRDGLLKLYPDMDGLWEETFFQQQITVCKKVPNNSNFHYSRDDGFMEDITKLVKEFGISKKDTWNPADIWLVENPTAQMKKLNDCNSLAEVNAELRTMFVNNIVVGISLKKLSGKQAMWELVNVDATTFKNKSSLVIGNCRCSLEPGGATDTVLEVMNGGSKVGKFQIRQNSTGWSNLKVEGTAQGQGAARLGKVPLEMLADLMKEYKLSYLNDNKKYPRSAAEFLEKVDEYKDMYDKISGKVETGINANQFEDKIVGIYNTKKDIGLSKLMQIQFLSEIYSLKKTDLNDFVTSMYFLAQKKGKLFGPFAKLY